MTFPTPDAAIRWAVLASPLGARAIDYGRVPGGQADAELAVRSYSAIHAVLGQLEERERQVVTAYALGASYRRTAKLMRISDRTVRRLHRPAWERVRGRLVELEIVA